MHLFTLTDVISEIESTIRKVIKIIVMDKNLGVHWSMGKPFLAWFHAVGNHRSATPQLEVKCSLNLLREAGHTSACFQNLPRLGCRKD